MVFHVTTIFEKYKYTYVKVFRMIIQLPAVPNYPEQVRAAVDILERELPSYVRPGVQIYRGNIDSLQVSDRYLFELVGREIPREFVKTLHLPFPSWTPRRETSLSYLESERMVLDNIRLAEDMGARSITLHPGTIFYRQSHGIGEFVWRPELDQYDIAYREVKGPAIERLKRIAQTTELVIGVENMPIPINGDDIDDPSKNLYEPSMVTFEDLMDFCERASTVSNLKITFDISHAKISQVTVNRLKGVCPDSSRAYLHGVDTERVEYQPLVSYVLGRLLERAKISDVQLGDVLPSTRLPDYTFSESTQLGEGLLGEEIWHIVRMMSEYPDIPISIDVREQDQDYIERPNQVKSIRRLLQELG